MIGSVATVRASSILGISPLNNTIRITEKPDDRNIPQLRNRHFGRHHVRFCFRDFRPSLAVCAV